MAERLAGPSEPVKLDLAAAIEAADTRLFDAIPAELTPADRASLLAIQRAVRASGSYTYLEIGSHLGGSIQPHLLDPSCGSIVSIDPRPLVQADQRGMRFGYPENSTQGMLARLAALAPQQVAKVRTIEAATPQIEAGQMTAKPDLMFVDGEHTDRAARQDFDFCKRCCGANGIIVFHDAPIVYNALASIVAGIGRDGLQFRAYHLPDTLFVVELGSKTLLGDASMCALALNSHMGYLKALQLNDGYRRFANLLPMRLFRRVATAIGFGSWLSQFGYGVARDDERPPS